MGYMEKSKMPTYMKANNGTGNNEERGVLKYYSR